MASDANVGEVTIEIENIWRQFVPEFPIAIDFADENILAQYSVDHLRAQIMTAFSIIALLIACFGLFALAAFSAERRTKEIGIRKVYGASVAAIVRLVS